MVPASPWMPAAPSYTAAGIVYPDAARRNRVQGVVTVEATRR